MSSLLRLACAAFVAALFLPTLPAGAAPAAPNLDAAARDLLKNQCADCHFSGVKDGRKPKRPLLDGTLSREELAALLGSDKTTPVVKLGDPEGSDLFQVVSLPDADEDRMPKSTEKDPRRALTADEKNLLARWIRGDELAAAEAPRSFLREVDVLRLVRDDLRSQPNPAGLRYLTLHHLYNLGAAAEPTSNLELYRAGVAKLLNSLSWEPHLARPEAIGPGGVVLRVRLSDYGWNDATWRLVAERYPYGFVADGRDAEHADLLAEYASRAAYPDAVLVRADWFVFACAQPPLYDELLYRAKTPAVVDGTAAADHALESYLGINVFANLRQAAGEAPDLLDDLVGAKSAGGGTAKVLRAGFNNSGVSDSNRLIERHQQPNGGAYWKSYDFNPIRRLKEGNLILFPLGPRGAGLSSQHEFQHDGGEVIFNLPNGLQGYLLTTADGKRLAAAPNNIVRDQTTFRAGRDILNGISCMICHDAGMKRPPKTDAAGRVEDDVLPGVQNRLPDFREDEKRALRGLYANKASLNAALDGDAARFNAATRALGAAGGIQEPVGAVYGRFLRPLDGAAVLAELGIEPAPSVVAKLPEIMARIESPVVKTKAELLRTGAGFTREEFLELFRIMAASLGKRSLAPFRATAFAEFGAGLKPFDASGPVAPPPPPVEAQIPREKFLRADSPLLYRMAGPRGAPMTPGVNGEAGYSGADGDPDGDVNGGHGAPGQPGKPGGNGSDGGKAADAVVNIVQFATQSGWIARIDVACPERGDFSVFSDFSQQVVFNFRGGDGGQGGAGGSGGDGGLGGKGALNFTTHQRGRGGNGAAPGAGGTGGRGGDGGPGGKVTVRITGSADFIAKVKSTIFFDARGGSPGAGGNEGDAGLPGRGGYSWGSTPPGRDGGAPVGESNVKSLGSGNPGPNGGITLVENRTE